MSTANELIAQIGEELNRSDMAVPAARWLTHTHRHLQRTYNFDCMKKTQITAASGIEYAFAAPTDLKEPRMLGRTASAAAPLVPAAANAEQSPFYIKTSYEDVLARRGGLLLDNRETDQAVQRYYAIEGGSLELCPKNTLGAADYFFFNYFALLPFPTGDTSDWFTTNAPDYLLYKSLIDNLAYLAEVDSRAEVWRAGLTTAWQFILGHAISIEYGGEELVMRG